MGALQVITISFAVQVCRHRGDKTRTVLLVVRPAHFDPRDFCHRIGSIRFFQWTGQQVFFLEGLRRDFRIDATRAQEEQPIHSGAVGFMDYAGLNPDILTKKVGWVRIVRQDAADFCRREKNILGALC